MRQTFSITIAFVLLTCCAPAALAQSAPPAGFIGIGIGPSIPFGSLARASAVNPRADHAAPGYTDTFLNVARRIGPHWGVAGLAAYSEFVTPNDGDDDWWQVATVMVGPMYTIPLGARAALDLKAMAGFVALTPVIDSYTTGHKTGAGFGGDLRAVIRYDVFTHWAVYAEAGLETSRSSFPSGLTGSMGSAMSGFGIAYRPSW